ncbi:MAG: hypothetical protein WC584_01855 [Candidatus Pacearchaeota archaeon]
MIKSKENDIGARAFLIGVILAIVIGVASSTLIRIQVIADYNDAIYAVLIILGIIVGFMNVTGKDSQTFMIAGAVLVIVSKFGMDSISGSLIGIGISDIFSSTFRALLVLFVPATIIVALKTVFSIARV